MLRSEEVCPGNQTFLASEGLSVLMPRSPDERLTVFGRVQGEWWGVLLNGDLPAQAYVVRDDETWAGFSVRGARIEVDETSAFNASLQTRAGAVVRKADLLILIALTGNHPRVSRATAITLEEKLPVGSNGETVGFLRWVLVIGEGADRRELFHADVEEFESQRSAALDRA